MDVQHAFLSKVILDRDIITAVNAHITPEFFTDDSYRMVYEHVLHHWRTYNTAPDEAVVKLSYPSMDWKDYGQPIEVFINQLRKRRKRSIIVDGFARAAQYLNSTAPDAVDQMHDILLDALRNVHLETSGTDDLDVSQMYEETVRVLTARMDNPGVLRGISSGFKGIDYVTGGWQPEQFIVLIGLPKALKSSTLLYMAMTCHEQAQSPLFVGFEMSNEEQLDRLRSLYGGVGLSKILNGTLNGREFNVIERETKRLRDMRKFMTSVDMDSALTVSGLQAKILEAQPDVVFVDGAYLMQSEIPKIEPGSAQALSDIARALKRLAQNQKIPIIVTTQASQTRTRGGQLNASSAMYTQAWRQSADVLLGVERMEPDAPDDGEVLIRLKVLTSRSGPRAETVLAWDWTQGRCIEMDPSSVQISDD